MFTSYYLEIVFWRLCLARDTHGIVLLLKAWKITGTTPVKRDEQSTVEQHATSIRLFDYYLPRDFKEES